MSTKDSEFTSEGQAEFEPTADPDTTADPAATACADLDPGAPEAEAATENASEDQRRHDDTAASETQGAAEPATGPGHSADPKPIVAPDAAGAASMVAAVSALDAQGGAIRAALAGFDENQLVSALSTKMEPERLEPDDDQDEGEGEPELELDEDSADSDDDGCEPNPEDGDDYDYDYDGPGSQQATDAAVVDAACTAVAVVPEPEPLVHTHDVAPPDLVAPADHDGAGTPTADNAGDQANAAVVGDDGRAASAGELDRAPTVTKSAPVYRELEDAGPVVPPPTPPPGPQPPPCQLRDAVAAALLVKGITIERWRPLKGGLIASFSGCPWHGRRHEGKKGAWICVTADGRHTAGCNEETCAGYAAKAQKRGWESALELLNLLPPEGPEQPSLHVKDLFPGAPLGGDLEIPEVHRYRWVAKDGHVEGPPVIFIVDRSVDIRTGEERQLLMYLRGTKWYTIWTSRTTTGDPRSLCTLRSRGLPVVMGNNGTAADAVPFLEAFEAHNIGRMPARLKSTQMGWIGRGDRPLGFLWGPRWIGTDKADSVELDVQDDPGAKQLVEGFRVAGTPEGWHDIMELLLPFAIPMVMVYAAVASVLLVFLPCGNPILDLSSVTSLGKTTVLRAAAAIWGDPRERGGILQTWASTLVHIERYSALLGSHPIILDDTNKCPDPKMLKDVVYNHEDGQGKGRGNTEGTRYTPNWRAVLLSTGEARITGYSEHGGQQARVVAVDQTPFDGGGADKAELTKRLTSGFIANHGHAGPRVVQIICANMDKHVPRIKALYDEAEAFYLTLADGNPVAGRQASTFASFEVAGIFLHKMEEWPVEDVRANLVKVWQATAASRAGADPPKKALEAVYNWVCTNQARFWGHHEVIQSREGSRIVVPAQGWAGSWKRSDNDDRGFAIEGNVLRKTLLDLGHEPNGVIAAWQERGWLVHGDGHGFTTKMQVHESRPRCYCIHGDTLRALGLVGA